MDDKKRFRLFAGPNGSGKTTLINKIADQFNLGYFINADIVENKLYFICTKDPEINRQRIKNRIMEGGHPVPDQKIEQRYYRSLELLYDAFRLAERAFIIDNSEETPNVLIEKNQTEIRVCQDEIPEWAGLYLLDKL